MELEPAVSRLERPAVAPASSLLFQAPRACGPAVRQTRASYEKRFVGLADPSTDKLLMKVDSGLPVVESAPEPGRLSWSAAS